MQSWSWGEVPSVATGKLPADDNRRRPIAVSEDGIISREQAFRERRTALEEDVSKLRKKHAHEVNVRRALERALQRPVGVLPRIPSYLPSKTQKLLAEVAVLEEEVIRLESHVVNLRQELHDGSLESSVWGAPKLVSLGKLRTAKDKDAINRRPNVASSSAKDLAVPKLPLSLKSMKEAPYDIHKQKVPAKELLFQYEGLQKPWRSMGKTGRSSLFKQFNSVGWNEGTLDGKKQCGSIPRNTPDVSASVDLTLSWNRKHQIALPTKSLASSPRSSPLHGTKYSPNSTARLWEKENMPTTNPAKSPISSKLSFCRDESWNTNRKSLFASKAANEAKFLTSPRNFPVSGVHRIVGSSQPNELSEELVKCLVNIYSKLARLTPISASKSSVTGCRSSTQSLGFRASLKTKSTGHSFNGDTQGPDYYGVCNGSYPRDIGPYQQVQEITGHTIDTGGVAGCAALYRKLSGLMEHLRLVDLQGLTHQHKLAFWINTYNACMMNAFLENGIPNSPSKVVALLRKAVVNVGGYLLNASTIEHFILRLPCTKNARSSPWRLCLSNKVKPEMMCINSSGMEDIMEQRAFGLDGHEPLITFALCCGSRSSPALRVYTASELETELESAKRDYLQAAIGVGFHKKIFVPKLLEWYMWDFANDVESLLEWVCEQLPSPLHEAVLDCLIHPKEGILLHSIEVMPYDFNFRYLFLL